MTTTIHPHRHEIFEVFEKNDEKTVMDFLEKKKIPLTTANWVEQTIGHVAAKKGMLNIVKYVLEKEPSILNVEDDRGNSMLFLAIEYGHLDVVKYLVEQHKADIFKHYIRCSENTAIHRAAEFGQLDILKYFIEEKNGDITLLNDINDTPIAVAAKNKHYHLIKYLAEQKKVNLTKQDYNRILMISVNIDDLKLMKYILDERKIEFDINTKLEADLTLVHRAVLLNRMEILKYLCSEKKADVNVPDKWGKTPLHSAAGSDYYEASEYLIQQGANLEAKDDRGHLPRDKADEDALRKLLKIALRRQRIPRSVPESDTLNRIARPSPWRKIIGDSSLSVGYLGEGVQVSDDISCSQLQSFLLVAKMFIKKARGSSYQQAEHWSPSSPQEIIHSYINPVAIESVQTLPHFGKLA